MSLRPAVNSDVYSFSPSVFPFSFVFSASLLWTDGLDLCFFLVDLREMSERRRSAAALSSRAHAFSVEALIGSNKKRKLRGWEEKELELSMESLAADGEDPAHCLDMDPGQSARKHAQQHSLKTVRRSGSALNLNQNLVFPKASVKSLV